MEKLHLDIDKVQDQMKKFEVDRKWIAEQLGITRQAVGLYFIHRPVKAAEKLAPLFNMKPKDLIE